MGWYGEPFQHTGGGFAPLGPARLEPVADLLGRDLQCLRQPVDHLLAAIGFALEGDPVDRHDHRCAVGDKCPARLVEDESAHRRVHHLARRVALRCDAVGLARKQLEVEQPEHECSEKGEDENAEDEQAKG